MKNDNVNQNQQMKEKAQALLRAGRLHEARDVYADICANHKKDAESWFFLGGINGQLGNYSDAENCYRQVIKLRPDSVQAYDNLGVALQYLGKNKEAMQCLEKALEINPGYSPAYYNMGNTYRMSGDFFNAKKSYSKVLKIEPGFVSAAQNLAFILLQEGNYDEVVELLESLVRSYPTNSLLGVCLGRAYHGLGNEDDAQKVLEEALKQNSSDAIAHFYMGEVIHGNSGYHEAEKHYRKAIEYKGDFYQAKVMLGSVLRKQGRLDEAVAVLEESVRERPEQTEAQVMLSVTYEHKGMPEEALQCLEPLLGGHDADPNVALAMERVSRHFNRRDEAINFLKNALKGEVRGNEQLLHLHFSLARLYDAAGAFDSAFDHFKVGNDLIHHQYDEHKARQEIENIINIYTSDFLASAPRVTNSSSRPVFIVGMPRSGTSLVEQILASHPDITGAGELNAIQSLVYSLKDNTGDERTYPECMKTIDTASLEAMAGKYLQELEQISVSSARVTDKMPHNFQHLGLIELLFPAAQVIHCVRDPRDTCLSCYFQDFGRQHQYSTNLRTLGKYYNSYRKLMEHWKSTLKLSFIDIKYEDIVTDQENSSRSLIEFCGLEWDDQCLSFYENDRIVTTASYDQVRRPVYSSSVGRWRNYESQLGDLLEVLDN